MTTHNTPAPTIPVQNWSQSTADTLYIVAIVGGLAVPGALLGALLVAPLWMATRQPLIRRIATAVLAAIIAFLPGTLIPGWLGQLLLDSLTSTPNRFTVSQLIVSVCTELLLAPAFVVVLQAARALRLRTALGMASVEREHAVKRSRVMRKGFQPSRRPLSARTGSHDHEPGLIRLGEDELHRIFDLVASEIAQHISVPGATGWGKTNTLMRLIGGALINGYGIVVIDCKGTELTGPVIAIAERHGVLLHIVDPDSPSSIGYDPCTGDAVHVANKLVGAFTFGAEAEIYKNVAMEVIPVIVRGLKAARVPVTLRKIYDTLSKGGMARLARAPRMSNAQRDLLQQLESAGGVGAAGYTGLQRRLGALIQGKFGPLFAQRPALDWDDVTETQSLTYLSLSKTAASEDVGLYARVIVQDLKQLCDARLRLIERGEPVTPMLVVFDEFAALDEPRQIVDLMLQARAARMSIVIASQYLPESIPIRIPFLQAGVLICHRTSAADAEALAAEFGTHDAREMTSQVDFETGDSKLGTQRAVKEYNVHPDTFRELGVGMAAVYARASNRRALVRVFLP